MTKQKDVNNTRTVNLSVLLPSATGSPFTNLQQSIALDTAEAHQNQTPEQCSNLESSFKKEYRFGIVVFCFESTLNKQAAFPQKLEMVHCPSNTMMVHILKGSDGHRTFTFLQFNTSRRKNQNVIYHFSKLVDSYTKEKYHHMESYLFLFFFKKKQEKNKDHPNLFPQLQHTGDLTNLLSLLFCLYTSKRLIFSDDVFFNIS